MNLDLDSNTIGRSPYQMQLQLTGFRQSMFEIQTGSHQRGPLNSVGLQVHLRLIGVSGASRLILRQMPTV